MSKELKDLHKLAYENYSKKGQQLGHILMPWIREAIGGVVHGPHVKEKGPEFTVFDGDIGVMSSVVNSKEFVQLLKCSK